MAVEQKWLAVAPELFTADGSSLGVIKVLDTAGFKVKQRAVVSAVGLPDIQVQIKRVVSSTQMIVGPLPEQLQPAFRQQGNQLLTVRTDLSAYTLLNSAYVYAEEQEKSKLKIDDIWSAVYEQEPTVAIRVVDVDKYGNFYDKDNPMPIIFDGTVEIGEVEVIGTNGNIIEPNADGSINVNVVETPIAGHNVLSIFNEVAAVASGVETQITSYTVPVGKTAVLQRINTSGENVARYNVYLNGSPFDVQRTYFGGDFNGLFEYITGTAEGFVLNATDVVSVKVLHSRPFVGNFNARIQVLEIT